MTTKLTEIPRRIDINQMVPAERAIRAAMLAVEELGAHPLLTDAISFLSTAKDRVGDYVDLPKDQKEFVVKCDYRGYCAGIDTYDGETEWTKDKEQARIFRGATWREFWGRAGYTIEPKGETI